MQKSKIKSQKYNSKFKSILVFSFFIVALHFAFFAFRSDFVLAQSLRYPIPELGYCRDAKECYLYCEIPGNKAACWSYGKHVLHSQVLSEHTTSDEQEAQRLGITFPIAELGNCASASLCRAYCERQENRRACMDFARKKGLGQYQKYQSMVEEAKRELGCSSMESCQAYCSNPENIDRCMAFAEKFAPPEAQEAIQKQKQMLSSAKEILGCDSFTSCQSFCQNPANNQKCMEFAESQMPEEFRRQKQELLDQAKQHLPCDSFESCKAYCDNPENNTQCRLIQEPGRINIEVRKEENFTCDTQGECERWCQENPDKCPGFQESDDYRRFKEESGKMRQEGKELYEQYQDYAPTGSQNYQQY